jgi:hypothetical protein
LQSSEKSENKLLISTELASICVTTSNLESRVADQQRDHITELTDMAIFIEAALALGLLLMIENRLRRWTNGG